MRGDGKQTSRFYRKTPPPSVCCDGGGVLKIGRQLSGVEEAQGRLRHGIVGGRG